MNKKLPSSIKKAVEAGELIAYEKILERYSKKEREEIFEKARHIRAALELRKLRKALNLSQGEFARKISVKREFISRIESGRQNVTLATLYRIAEATGKRLTSRFSRR